MKEMFFVAAFGLAFATAPASAMCIKGCTVDADYVVGSIAAGGGLNGVLGGSIKKRYNESGTGTINEADLTVQIDKNGIKKIDGTFHSASYGYNENFVKSKSLGTTGSGSVSGTGVTGGMHASIDIKKN